MTTYQYRADTGSIEIIEYDDGGRSLSVNPRAESLFKQEFDVGSKGVVPGIVLKPLIIAQLVQPTQENEDWESIDDQIKTTGELGKEEAEAISNLLRDCDLDEDQQSRLAQLARETDWGQYLSHERLSDANL